MAGNKLQFLNESRASTSSASLQMHGSTHAGKSELARALHSRLAEIIPKCFKSPREIFQRIIPETDAKEVSIIMDKVDKLTPEEQMDILGGMYKLPEETPGQNIKKSYVLFFEIVCLEGSDEIAHKFLDIMRRWPRNYDKFQARILGYQYSGTLDGGGRHRLPRQLHSTPLAAAIEKNNTDLVIPIFKSIEELKDHKESILDQRVTKILQAYPMDLDQNRSILEVAEYQRDKQVSEKHDIEYSRFITKLEMELKAQQTPSPPEGSCTLL